MNVVSRPALCIETEIALSLFDGGETLLNFGAQMQHANATME
jgi:hypothetical protein